MSFLAAPAFGLCDLLAQRLRRPFMTLFDGTRESCGGHLVEMGADGRFLMRFARDRVFRAVKR
ncbi:MAG TPA: hypothetical protein PLN52_00105 [Opitutaceae bacterium]|nr:hypothetical protein [Opitutaceae bacterium]